MSRKTAATQGSSPGGRCSSFQTVAACAARAKLRHDCLPTCTDDDACLEDGLGRCSTEGLCQAICG